MNVEPTNLIERAADAAMHAAERVLADAGATVGVVCVALKANGVPAGELDSVVATGGDEIAEDPAERARELIAFLVGEAASVGEAIGVNVVIAPMLGGSPN